MTERNDMTRISNMALAKTITATMKNTFNEKKKIGKKIDRQIK